MGKKVKTHYYLICIHWVLILSLFHDYLQTILFLSIVFAFFYCIFCYFLTIEAKYIRVIILCVNHGAFFFSICCLYSSSVYGAFGKKLLCNWEKWREVGLCYLSNTKFSTCQYIRIRLLVSPWRLSKWPIFIIRPWHCKYARIPCISF